MIVIIIYKHIEMYIYIYINFNISIVKKSIENRNEMIVFYIRFSCVFTT